jgi:hypothetical protein
MQTLSGALGNGNGANEALGLVGRDMELAALLHALADAREGKPGFFLLGGPAGIGESSLVRALAAKGHAAAVPVGIGRGHDGLRVPYLPPRDALRAVGTQGAAGDDPLIDLLNAGSSEPTTEAPGTWAGTLDAAHGVEELYRDVLK